MEIGRKEKGEKRNKKETEGGSEGQKGTTKSYKKKET